MKVELEITNADQYATAYLDGKPVATVQRRRVYEKGPAWKVYATDGSLMFVQERPCVAAYLARRIAVNLEMRAAS